MIVQKEQWVRIQYTVGKECNTAFCYLDLYFKQYKNYISLDQTHYVKLLEPVNLQDENSYIHDAWQSTIDKLIWINGQTRPDISLDLYHLAANHLKNSTLADVEHLNNATSHLKQSTVSLIFQDLGEISKLKLAIYADAAHGNLANGAN